MRGVVVSLAQTRREKTALVSLFDVTDLAPPAVAVQLYLLFNSSALEDVARRFQESLRLLYRKQSSPLSRHDVLRVVWGGFQTQECTLDVPGLPSTVNDVLLGLLFEPTGRGRSLLRNAVASKHPGDLIFRFSFHKALPTRRVRSSSSPAVTS